MSLYDWSYLLHHCTDKYIQFTKVEQTMFLFQLMFSFLKFSFRMKQDLGDVPCLRPSQMTATFELGQSQQHLTDK